MDKTNFILYKDFKPNVDILSNEQAGKLFKALFEYVENRKEPNFDDDGMLKMAFITLKTTLERDLKKYKMTVERNRENGKKGGRPPSEGQETQSVNNKPKKPSGLSGNPKNPSEPKKADSDRDRDSVSDKDIDKESDKKKDKKKEPDFLDDFSQDFKDTFKEFKKMRTKMKSPMTEHAEKLLVNKLKKITTDENQQIELLNRSIENGWKGVYESNDTKAKKTEVDWRTR